jgi:hypothetical protein
MASTSDVIVIIHIVCNIYERRPLGKPMERWKNNIKTDFQLEHGLD